MVRLANIKVPQMYLTSGNTGLRNANINSIYPITIVSYQDKKAVLVGAVGWEEMERAELILCSQVVKLKFVTP